MRGTVRSPWLIRVGDRIAVGAARRRAVDLGRSVQNTPPQTSAPHEHDHDMSREGRLNFSFAAKNYLYFFPERCDHKK